MPEKMYYTKNETAKILGVHPRTIERYLVAGKLQGARLGKLWKVSDEDIKAFYETIKKETAKKIKEREAAKKSKES